MSDVLTPINELDAVNSLLRIIKQPPVNTLEGGNNLNVHTALASIEEASRKLQVKGWYFNRLPETELVPTTSGTIGQYKPAENILTGVISRIDRNSDTHNLVWRGNKFFNRKTRTDEGFTKTLRFDLIEGLVFADLPEQARSAIYLRAGINFQMAQVGSGLLERLTEKDAVIAYGELLDAELDAEEVNIFGTPSAFGRTGFLYR